MARRPRENTYLQHVVASLAYQLLALPMTPIKRRLAKQMLPFEARHIGGDRWILLNREHKPLGWPTKLPGRVDYCDPMFEFAVLHISRDRLELLAEPRHDSELLCLYNPTRSAPWEDYEGAVAYRGVLVRLLEISDISEEGAL